jgi:peptidoglycan hydrolase-like protein with peptidoglycan-binding domain
VNITAVQIRDVQDGLKKLGYWVGPVDGIVGPLTREAIVMFQRRKCLNKHGKLYDHQQWGEVTEALHAKVIGELGHADYVAPTPPTDLEMDDARKGLLRTQRLLKSWEDQ